MRRIRFAVLLLVPALAYCQDISVDAVSTMKVCSPSSPASASPCATAPKPISKLNPSYPETARRSRKEGTVTVGLIVTKDGSVSDAHVVKSVDKDIDKAALDAVNQWKFEPGTYEGKPVDVELNITVNFSLSPNRGQSAPAQSAEQSASAEETRNLWSDAGEAYKRSDFATAANLYRRITVDTPQNANGWNELGRSLVALNQLDAAIDAYQTSIKLDPGSRYAYNNLGTVLWRQRKYEDAAAQFRKQIVVNPDDHYAHRNLGMMLRDQHKCTDAMPEFQKALALTPNHAETLVAEGDCDLDLGNRAKGVSELEQAINVSAAPNILNSAAYSLARRNIELDTAEKWSDRCLSIEKARLQDISLDHVTPEQLNYVFWVSAYWDTRGWIYFLRGDLAEAQSYIESAWSLLTDATVGDHLGQVYEKLGRSQDAEKVYAMAVASADESSRAKIDLDDLAHARERLAKLSNESLENAVAHARADLRSKGTMYVANKDSVETNADFSVLVSSEKGLEFHPLTAADKAAKFVPSLQSAKSPIALFKSAGVEVPLRGKLTCHAEEPQCRFEFLRPEDAVNLARTELAATSATLTHDPHVYDNPAMGMRISLPDEWRLVREEPGSFSRPHNAMFGKPGSTAMFMLTREHFEGSPELYGKMMEAFFSKQANFQRTGTETVKQDGLSGTRWNVNWTQNGIDYSAVIEMFGVGDDYYRITTFAPKEVYGRYAESFENLIRSVQFPMLHASPQLLDSQK